MDRVNHIASLGPPTYAALDVIGQAIFPDGLLYVFGVVIWCVVFTCCLSTLAFRWRDLP